MTWVAAGAAGVSALSGLFGASKQKKQQKEMLAYQRSLRLDPVSGQFGQIGVQDGVVRGGMFGDLQSQFGGAAGDVLGGLDFNSGLPPEIAEALGMMRGGIGQPQTNSLMQGMFSGAAGLLPELSQGFGATRDSTLANLRASALPEQQRAVDSTMTRLFAQGRLGSTGGANIMGRLAEAQNQQDLGFQLAAGDEARAASSDVMGRFQAMLTGGMGIDNENFARTSDYMRGVTGTAGLPGELQQQKLGMATNLLGSSVGIQDLMSQAFGNALNMANSKTNVRVAGAGLNTSTIGSPSYSASPVADAFGALAGGASGGFDISAILSRLGSRRAVNNDVDRFQTL